MSKELTCPNGYPPYTLDVYAIVHFTTVGIVNTLCFVFAVGFNSLSVHILPKTRIYRSMSGLLLLALSCSDLMTGLSVQPIFAVHMFLLASGRFVCKLPDVLAIVGYAVGGVSFLTIVLITVEKYIAILYPFWHERLLLTARYKFVMFGISLWLSWIAFTIITLLLKSFVLFNVSIGVLSMLTYSIIFFCYGRIYTVVRRTKARINEQEIGNRSKQARDSKALKTTFMILATFMLCYTPTLVYTSYGFFSSSPSQLGFQYLLPWAQTSGMMTATFHPLVYYLRLGEIKGEVRSMIFGVEVQPTTSSSSDKPKETRIRKDQNLSTSNL